MGESLRSKMLRLGFNFFPVYRRTGARITYIDDCWTEVRIRLPLNLWTRNYVGTLYGGSMYAAVDPIFMVMLIKVLGPNYVVWLKEATISFRKPGRGTLYARFLLDDAEIRRIRDELATKPSLEKIYNVDLTDAEGVVHASIRETLYIAGKKGSAQPE